MSNVKEDLTIQNDDTDVIEIKEKDKDRKALKGAIINLLIKLVVIVACCLIFFFVVFGVKIASNSDMKPAVKQGDLLLFYRLGNDYVSGDVVVYEVDGKEYVGRVVAIAGDTIQFNNDGYITLNGYAQNEDIYYDTYVEWESAEVALELDKNEIYILGDYRTECVDSRSIGIIKCDDVIGKVITVIRKRGI